MPYTPPSHRSPASSTPSSPSASRRSSFHAGSPTSRPALPRSASYTTKHRRSPSISASPITSPPSVSADASTRDITPPGTSDDLQGMLAAHLSPARQSPSPVADPRAMPPGAILSPPESSSEDEGAAEEMQKRGRDIENLAELKEAISTIPQHRESSPTRGPSPGDLLVLPSQHNTARITDAPSKQSLVNARLPTLDTLAISRAGPARKSSHARSATEPHIFVSKSADSMAISDDNSEGDEYFQKPSMVRKKSGELVRPALRPAAHRRPSSVPGTPIAFKAVHFDSHLEHVRHFLQVDRPTAVSATTSPNEEYESDAEYPFSSSGDKNGTRSPTYQWEIDFHHKLPIDSPLRTAMPVRLEKLWLSPDQKSLVGSVIVANMAFQKSVVCRFTFDYWKTVSEVAAEYSQDAQAEKTVSGYDRFQFNIKLSDLASLESKTLYMCLRYNVNGLEFWDNNDNSNFQVDFHKKLLPQNSRRSPASTGGRPANALPRSNRRGAAGSMPRPKSIPMGAHDDVSSHALGLGDADFLSEPGIPIRLKSSKSATSLPSDNLSSRLSAPSGQAFGHRYDFGASLSAAVQAHKDSMGSGRRGSDALYMKSHRRTSSEPEMTSASPTPKPDESSTKPSAPLRTTRPSTSPTTEAAAPSATATASTAPPVPGTESPSSASIASASYEEILNKYCFFGSKQSSPQAKEVGNGNGGGQYDESYGLYTHDTHSANSSASASPDMTDRSHKGAMHHSLRQNLDMSPFFQNAHAYGIGASPALSPLQNPNTLMHSTAGHQGSPSSSGGQSFSPMTGMSTVNHHITGAP